MTSILPLPDGARLRLPAGDGLEARFAEHNAARREAALARLATALHGVDVRGWSAATSSGPSRGTSTVGASGWALPAGDPADVERLRAGVTWRFDGTTVPGAAALADDLAGALSAQVTVSLVVADGPADGVRRWDDHDVVRIGLHGRARIGLAGPSVEAPVAGRSPDPTGPPAWEGELGVGDVLVVPRGWATDDASTGPRVRLELAVRRLRGTDVAAYVARRAGASWRLREPVPLDGTVDPDALTAGLDEADVDALAAEAVARWAAELRPAAAVGLGDLWPAPPADLHLAAPGGIVWVTSLPDAVPAGSAAVALAGHVVIAPPSDLATLLDDGGGTLRDALAGAALLRRAPR